MIHPRHAQRRARWRAFLAGLLFSACMILAFAPFSLWGLSLVALAPLVWLVESTSPKRERGVPSARRESPPWPRLRSGRREECRGEGRSAPAADEAPTDPAPRGVPTGPVAHALGSSNAGPFSTAVFAAIGTIPLYLFEHWWLWPVAGPGVPIVVLILILYPLAFVWTLLRLTRRWPRVPTLLGAPILWTGLEFFRGSIAFDGYPWYFVGHPLIAWWPAAAPAAVIGAIGVSFLGAGAGSALGWMSVNPRARAAPGLAFTLALGLLAFVPHAFLAIRTDRPRGTLRVGVVQTNLPQSNKMDWPVAQRIDDLLWFLEMTEEVARPDAAGRRPELIIWPETMFPGSSLDEQAREAERPFHWNVPLRDGQVERVPIPALAETLLDRQRALGIPMLVGAIGYDDVRYEPRPQGGADRIEGATYNSVFALSQGRVIGRYDKVHLTPFGEVMPYISAWPWLEHQLLGFAASGMTFELSAARQPRVLEVPIARGDRENFERAREAFTPVRIATPVCFESTDPALCRRLVNLADDHSGAPVLIVNPTNDGWFGPSDAGREHHLQLARWRAIENGVPVVRAANTGISCVIDHRGRVIARGVQTPEDGIQDARADGVLVADVPLPPGNTPYGRLGDWLGWGLNWGAVMLAVAAFWPGGQRRTVDSEPESSEGR